MRGTKQKKNKIATQAEHLKVEKCSAEVSHINTNLKLISKI